LCDPITIASLAVGAGGTAANFFGKKNAAQQQAQQFARWKEQQAGFRDAQDLKQKAYEEAARTAAQKGVDTASADNQKKVQAEEADRLAKEYTAPGSQEAAAATGPTSTADQMLKGGESGGDVFQADLARGLADSAASAKARIAAMANVNAYGGSSGGLGTVVPLAQQEAGQAINLQNNFRKGALSAYEAERRVQPVQVTYENPLADFAQSFLGFGMSRLGSAAGGGGTAVVPGANTSLFPAVPMPVPGKVPASGQYPWGF
jgi:hypothetical protein